MKLENNVHKKKYSKYSQYNAKKLRMMQERPDKHRYFKFGPTFS